MFEKLKNMFSPSKVVLPSDRVDLAREATEKAIQSAYEQAKDELESDIRFNIRSGRYTACIRIDNPDHTKKLKQEFESRGFVVQIQGYIVTVRWE